MCKGAPPATCNLHSSAIYLSNFILSNSFSFLQIFHISSFIDVVPTLFTHLSFKFPLSHLIMYSLLFRFTFTDLHRRFINLRTCRSSRRRRTSTLLIALLLCATSQSKMPENTKSQQGKNKIETATKYNTSQLNACTLLQCTLYPLSHKKVPKISLKVLRKVLSRNQFFKL